MKRNLSKTAHFEGYIREINHTESRELGAAKQAATSEDSKD